MVKTAVKTDEKKSGNSKKIRSGDAFFDIFNFTMVTTFFILVLYPIVYIISSSISNPTSVSQGLVKLLPVGFSTLAYETVYQYTGIFIGYRNSLFYTVFGTAINVIITIMAAYPLSRRDFFGRNAFMFIFTFTMFFNGGLIPTYLLVRNLGLVDTIWSMILPGAMSVYNVIITRTFFQTSLPDGLREAAAIDGCGNTRFLVLIVIPLSGAIIAVNCLFYAVWHWNTYFDALLYLQTRQLFPLQIFLREILIQNQIDYSSFVSGGDIQEMLRKQEVVNLLKYALIIVASLPLLVVYPFVQRYFVKGIMIGSIKG